MIIYKENGRDGFSLWHLNLCFSCDETLLCFSSTFWLWCWCTLQLLCADGAWNDSRDDQASCFFSNATEFGAYLELHSYWQVGIFHYTPDMCLGDDGMSLVMQSWTICCGMSVLWFGIDVKVCICTSLSLIIGYSFNATKVSHTFDRVLEWKS